GLRTGPHSLLVLKQKAEIHMITPETSLASETNPDGWTPIREMEVVCAELFPARTRLRLGSRTVEHLNANDPRAAIRVEDLLQDNLRRRQAAETDLLSPLPPRSNKRLRDYLLLAIAGNLLALLGFVFLPINPVVFVYLV